MVKKVEQKYDAEQIEVLEGLEAVRLRLGMYLPGGGDQRTLQHAIQEVVDNQIDEFMAGYGKIVKIVIMSDGGIKISDEGRGIPVAEHPIYKKSALELVMTKLHAGGKFNNENYKISSGLNGVGISVVNAISKNLEATVYRDGYEWCQKYEKGKPTTKVERNKKTNKTGTTILFYPDETILHDTNVKTEILIKKMRELSFLCPGLEFDILDERDGEKYNYYSKEGIQAFIKFINENKDGLFPNIPIFFSGVINDIQIDIALQYTDQSNDVIFSYCNTVATTDSGRHERGFKSGLTRVINNFAKSQSLLKDKDNNLDGDDVRSGMTAIVSIKIKNPIFSGQSKTKLENDEVESAVSQLVSEKLTELLESDPSFGKKVVDRALTAQRAKAAAKSASEAIRKKGTGFSMANKLSKCSSKNAQECELFIVEGDSAAGPAKRVRDSKTQAILPLRGKIINALKCRVDKLLENNEVQNLIYALGTGIANVSFNGDDEETDSLFNLEKLNYNKIILMSVVGNTPTLVYNKTKNNYEFVTVGNFIDNCLDGVGNYNDYQVLSFDQDSQNTKLSDIKNIIRHKYNGKIYKIKTLYNREIEITGGHSVFIYDNNQIKLKKGSDIKIGDIIVAPSKLPCIINDKKHLDILSLILENNIKNNIYIKGENILDFKKDKYSENKNVLFTENRVSISKEGWLKLIERRHQIGKSQKQIANEIGVKQAITICHWETLVNLPIVSHFQKYLNAIEYGDFNDFNLIESKIDGWVNYDKNTGNYMERVFSPYLKINKINFSDVDKINPDVLLVPQNHHEQATPRILDITEDLMWFLGWYLAEGSLSNGQISLSLCHTSKDIVFFDELKNIIKNIFGSEVKIHYNYNSNHCVKFYFNNNVIANLIRALGLHAHAKNKIIPNFVFGLTDNLKIKFLEGYFLGDGTVSKINFSFTTASEQLKNQLMYLLSQLSINCTCFNKTMTEACINEKIVVCEKSYLITITGKDNCMKAINIWKRHAKADQLLTYINNGHSKTPDNVYISEDLIGLPVKHIEIKEVVDENVYDFSIEKDENFICGIGGLCAHNTDADADGSHIQSLLLTFFFTYLKPIVEAGHLYIAKPPLFKVTVGSGKTKVKHYALDEVELAKLMKKHPNANVTRFKGLGEMDEDELGETSMASQTRTLVQVTIDDLAFTEKMFSDLMGEKAAPRKEYLVKNAAKYFSKIFESEAF